MSQVRSRENTFKVELSNFPKRPSIEELQQFVHVNLGLTVGQVKRLQINHAQNCAHVKCSELKIAQDTVATHDGKHVIEVNKSKVKVRLVMEDGGVEVKIHDLSENVTNDEIVAFLKHYGDVLSIREIFWGESFAFHGVSSGIRVAKMVLRRHIKSFATILGESTLISYRGQPMTCKHCTLTQHLGMSCVENKKLLGQKADINARLRNPQGATPSSYASVLTKNSPNTNTLLPKFNSTLLGPLLPKRPMTIANESTNCSASLNSELKIALARSVGSSSSGGSTMDAAEHSVGSQTSGGSSSSNDMRDDLKVTEHSAVATEVGSGGGTMTHDTGHSAETTAVASGDGMLSSPLPPTAPNAEGDNNDSEEMETESASAGGDRQQESSPSSSTKQLDGENEDGEMPSSSATTSSALASTFKSPLPVTYLTSQSAARRAVAVARSCLHLPRSWAACRQFPRLPNSLRSSVI